MPHELLSLPDNEQAFIVAAINIKVKQDKKEADKIKARSRRR
nr:MAG TPA: hypothetical protein [Caudoviricetes sp.]